MPKTTHREIRDTLIRDKVIAQSGVIGNKRRSIKTIISKAFQNLETLGVEPQRLATYCTRFKKERQLPLEFGTFCRPILNVVSAQRETAEQIRTHLKPIFDAIEGRMIYEQRRKGFGTAKRLDEEYNRIVKKR
ncbi:MAG: hypothetical protein ABIH20_01485 [Candidatus Diapherotrites archaeon]